MSPATERHYTVSEVADLLQLSENMVRSLFRDVPGVLRISTPRKGSFKGIGLRKSGKWRAQLRHEGRTIYAGLWNTPEEAAAAYDRRAVELFGEFARLNFPAGGAA